MLGAFKVGVMGAAGGGADTFFADYVKLRLTMDGANGSTTFADYSSNAHTVTANGNAQVTTSAKKFGTGGLLVDGTGDYISIPDHPDWDIGSGPFTVDMWIKPDVWPQASQGTMVDLFSNGAALQIRSQTSGRMACDLGGLSSSYIETGVLSISTSVFTHVRVTWGGSGTAFKIIVDGVEELSTVLTGSFNSITGPIAVGGRISNAAFAFDGVIDDFRLAVGAEATDTVPPSAALPIS